MFFSFMAAIHKINSSISYKPVSANRALAASGVEHHCTDLCEDNCSFTLFCAPGANVNNSLKKDTNVQIEQRKPTPPRRSMDQQLEN